MNLADRIRELRRAAIDAGVADQVGDITDPQMLAQAYASVLGLDQWLAIDPRIPLEEVAEITSGLAQIEQARGGTA